MFILLLQDQNWQQKLKQRHQKRDFVAAEKSENRASYKRRSQYNGNINIFYICYIKIYIFD